VLLDDFDERALAVAGMAASPNTRRAYATAYRGSAGFLRARYSEASKDTITIASVAAWRDELAAPGLAPSSVTQRVSAVRRLAATLGADPLVQQVRCTHVQRDEPRALSDAELDRLLRQYDHRGARPRDPGAARARGTAPCRARPAHARRHPRTRPPARRAPAYGDRA
jgi:site-specific recombinase XerD